VQDLVDAFAPRVVAAGGTGGLDNIIESVSVSELDDPIPWLAPGSFLLTSGMILQEDSARGAQLIRSLHAAGKAGIGLAMAPYWTEVPRTMVEASEELQFPLLRMSGGLPFHAVLRWAYGILTHRDSQDLQRVVSIQQSLAEFLAQDRSVEGIVRHLSDLLSADMLLFDWRGGVRLHYSHGSERAIHRDARMTWQLYMDSRGIVPAPTVLRRDGLEVHMQEVRLHGGLEWVLMAALPERPHATIPIERTVAFARTLLEAQVLAQRGVIGRLRQARASLLDELLVGRRQASELAERLAHHGIVGTEPWRFVVLAVEPVLPAPSPSLSTQSRVLRDKGSQLVDSYLDTLDAHFVSGWHSDCLAILMGMQMGDQPIDARQFASGLVQQVAHTLHLKGLRAGVSEAVVGIEPVSDAYTHARQALVSAPDGDGEATVALYEDLGLHYAALNALPEEYLVSLRSRFVQPLLDGDCREGPLLYRTLLVHLATDRSLSDTAQKLFLHRNTLRRRLARIERELEIDLRNSDDLTQLRMAICAADILTVREKLREPV
jgi:purine catabolism regulator